MNNSIRKSVSLTVVAGLFVALIFVGTFFLKLSTGIGYIHAGDGFILIAASLLPTPLAMTVAAVGGGLSDLLSGYTVFIPATVVIKALSCCFFGFRSKRLICKRNILAVAFALAVNVIGYYLYGSLLQGNFIVCLYELPLNIIQELIAAILFFSFAGIADFNPAMKSLIDGNIKYINTKQK